LASVLILGATGMLGHKLVQVMGERFDTWSAVRGGPNALSPYGITEEARVIPGVDAADPDSVVRAIARSRPDVVLNAVGIIKQLPEANDPLAAVSINSLFPHRLASLCDAAGARLIHVSTDCVFSGRKGGYTEGDVPDAEDLYGRSKLLGEVQRPPHLTLRTSIIGRELASANGLVEWFLANAGGRVQGYRNAIYTGLTTIELARLTAEIIDKQPHLDGLYHVSAEPISKHDLLVLLREAFGAAIEIEPFEDPPVDRSLDSTRFREAARYAPPDWNQLVADMASDAGPYDRWRRSS
jgi:dTDP-4-dehydrorhamnose reductase